MEVVKDNAGYLSNYEVLNLLQGVKSGKRQKMTQNQLATITYQTIRYLEETACKRQTPEKIRGFMMALEPFQLTKCEKLTLLNMCPQSALEIQLIIEDSEDRLSEEEVNALLEVVDTHLGEKEESNEPE